VSERYLEGNRGEERYRSEFEEWADMRDAATDATGGILIESTTDTPEQVIAANMLAPRQERTQTVTVAHAIRPRASDGVTDREHFTVEEFREECDGKELRQDKKRYQRNREEFRKNTPDFDAVSTNAGDVPIYESVRRTILKLDNGPQVEHFLGTRPEVADSLLALDPLAAAATVRFIARDLQSGMPLPDDATYSEYKSHTANRRARSRRGQ
jgi:hypothetical protein